MPRGSCRGWRCGRWWGEGGGDAARWSAETALTVVTVLARLHPGADAATCRARAHAVFGLINSTPHSAGRLPRGAMAELLAGMAEAAATR